MVAGQKGVPPVTLAGAERIAAPEVRETVAAPIRSFMGQLADLFSLSPRLDAPQDQNFSSGRPDDRNGFRTGGERPR